MSILDNAELLLQAKNYTGSGDWLDESGNGHNATINGALFKAYSPATGQYIYMPGTSGNYLSTPDAAALDLLGDIWIAGRFAMDDWTPAADQTLIAKWEDTSDERAYRLMVDTTGVLRLGWSTDGTSANAVSEDSTVAPTVSNGAALWVAGTLDASVGTVKFYTAEPAATPVWAQLGTTVVGSGATSIGATTAVLEVGSDNTGTAQLLVGEVYDAHVEDGYDEGVGTLQFDMSSTTPVEPMATFAETSTNGATVTINRSSSADTVHVVDRNMFILHTNDYLEVADHDDLDFAADESFTMMFGYREYNTKNFSVIMAKKNSTGNSTAGYMIWTEGDNDTKFHVAGGGAGGSDQGTDVVVGTAMILGGIRDVVADEIEFYTDGVGSGSPPADGSTATIANSVTLRFGTESDGGGNFMAGEIHSGAIWREALTATEALAAANLLALEDLVTGGYATGGEEGAALRTALNAAGISYQGTVKMLQDFTGDTTVGYASGRKIALGKD